MVNSDKKLEKKIQELSDKLEDTRTSNKPTDKTASNMSFAFKISSELIAGIAIGGFVGYYADEYFQTKPLFLIIFLLLGVAASLLNLYREIKNG
jgi:ATP synthase protein I